MYYLIPMAEAHDRSRRKNTGGIVHRSTKRKKRNLTGEFAATQLADHTAVKRADSRGGTVKHKAKRVDTANVSKPDGETVKVDIEAVEDNPAQKDYVRRDIITKGAVIDTPEGRARVTSRPGQEGVVNARLIE